MSENSDVQSDSGTSEGDINPVMVQALQKAGLAKDVEVPEDTGGTNYKKEHATGEVAETGPSPEEDTEKYLDNSTGLEGGVEKMGRSGQGSEDPKFLAEQDKAQVEKETAAVISSIESSKTEADVLAAAKRAAESGKSLSTEIASAARNKLNYFSREEGEGDQAMKSSEREKGAIAWGSPKEDYWIARRAGLSHSEASSSAAGRSRPKRRSFGTLPDKPVNILESRSKEANSSVATAETGGSPRKSRAGRGSNAKVSQKESDLLEASRGVDARRAFNQKDNDLEGRYSKDNKEDQKRNSSMTKKEGEIENAFAGEVKEGGNTGISEGLNLGQESTGELSKDGWLNLANSAKTIEELDVIRKMGERNGYEHIHADTIGKGLALERKTEAQETKGGLIKKGKELGNRGLEIAKEGIERTVSSNTREAVKGFLREKYETAAGTRETNEARREFDKKISQGVAEKLEAEGLKEGSLEYKARSTELIAEALGVLVEAQASVEAGDKAGNRFLNWIKDHPKVKMVIGGALTAGFIVSGATGNVAGIAAFGSLRAGWSGIAGTAGVYRLLGAIDKRFIDNRSLNKLKDKDGGIPGDIDMAKAVSQYARNLSNYTAEEGEKIGRTLLGQLERLNKSREGKSEAELTEGIIDMKNVMVNDQHRARNIKYGKVGVALTAGLVMSLVGGSRVTDKLADIQDLSGGTGDIVKGATENALDALGESADAGEGLGDTIPQGGEVAEDAIQEGAEAAAESTGDVLSGMPETLVDTVNSGDSIWSMSERMLGRFTDFEDLNPRQKILATDWLKDHFAREALERGRNPDLIFVGEQLNVSTTHAREAIQYALTH